MGLQAFCFVIAYGKRGKAASNDIDEETGAAESLTPRSNAFRSPAVHIGLRKTVACAKMMSP